MNDSDRPRVCSECRHVVRPWYPDPPFAYRCGHPRAPRDLITGERKHCTALRFLELYAGLCGKEGRWFEEREPTATLSPSAKSVAPLLILIPTLVLFGVLLARCAP